MLKTKANTGFVLVISVMVLVTLLMVGSYLIASSNSENKISLSQFESGRNYYLAEAGVNDMLAKIKNNADTKNNFLNGTLNAGDNISRTAVFGDNDASYAVAAVNTVPAEAWITATSTYQINGHTSQRVVKSYISKATGTGGANWNFCIYAGGRGGQQNGNFTFTGAGLVMVANGGRLHANQNFKVQGAEVDVNNGAVTAANNIIVNAGGQLKLTDSYQDAPTTTIDMLPIDFDSASSTSWKNRATATYTSSQFNNLPSGTTLNGIIYVSGSASIVGKNLTVNGVLVANGSINITESGQNLIVNNNADYGSGILGKGNVSFTTAGGQIKVDGLIYSGNTLSLTSAGTNFIINGGIVGFDATITASGGAITLNYMPQYFAAVTDPAYNQNAPLIQIDHWEEQY